MKQSDKSVVHTILISAFVAMQILADIGSLKLLGIGKLSMDAGTLIYPFTFVLRDLIHKKCGKKIAQTLIFSCAAINLFMAGFFALISFLPGDPNWELAKEFSAVLSPVWRIVVASIVAEVVSEIIDTEIFHHFLKKNSNCKTWIPSVVSNTISIPIDSAVFSIIAFLGVYPLETVISIFIANSILKFGISIIGLPVLFTQFAE
ncbi:MAG: queuosine precursor transporter [Spirochaetaceae bacterium]|nr:queuosine precursor transporter [Spirochaetaceae bacterium]